MFDISGTAGRWSYGPMLVPVVLDPVMVHHKPSVLAHCVSLQRSSLGRNPRKRMGALLSALCREQLHIIVQRFKRCARLRSGQEGYAWIDEPEAARDSKGGEATHSLQMACGGEVSVATRSFSAFACSSLPAHTAELSVPGAGRTWTRRTPLSGKRRCGVELHVAVGGNGRTRVGTHVSCLISGLIRL